MRLQGKGATAKDSARVERETRRENVEVGGERRSRDSVGGALSSKRIVRSKRAEQALGGLPRKVAAERDGRGSASARGTLGRRS